METLSKVMLFSSPLYADDLQIMAGSPASNFRILIDNFLLCLSHIDDFMSYHRLKLNQCKTQLIPIGTWQQTSRLKVVSVSFSNADIEFSQIATNLGFVFDAHLTMHGHVNTIIFSFSYQLCRRRMIKRFLNLRHAPDT